VPIPVFADFQALNAHLLTGCRRRLADRLRGQDGTIGERLERDLAAFQKPLPAAYDACDKTPGSVNSLSQRHRAFYNRQSTLQSRRNFSSTDFSIFLFCCKRSVVNSETGKVSLRRQLITCAVLCVVAIVVILLFHRQPYLPARCFPVCLGRIKFC
jgi:hypothetical protein